MATSPSRLSASLQRFCLDGIRDTGITVGDGSYATVLQYDFRGLKCVGKKIHRLLYEHASPAQKADMLRRFEEECELFGRLHHPNIAQFLGVHVETGSELPVLVMEYLLTNLSGYLDRHGVLPTEISYVILRDVALGLRYLHEYSPPIVHRNLSASNVLLTASLSAKISDLGVSKILNITPSQMIKTMSTKDPGALCYMPPEALMAQPNYTRKVDSYSFGVLILHMLCGEWPFPSDCDHFQPDERSPVTEVDQKVQFMQKMGSDHPLLGLVRQCLSNTPDERPESADILQQVNAALSHVPAPDETVLHQLEGLRNENKHLGTEVQTLGSDVQRLEMEIQSLRIENEQLRNGNQTPKECSQTQPSSSGAAVKQPLTCDVETNAKSRPLPLWEKWQDFWVPVGNRDIILIISNGEATARNNDVVPRCSGEITEKDKKEMISQGLSPDECSDDINIVQARVRLDKRKEMVDIICSVRGSELSRGCVLQRIEKQLKASIKTGVTIYYIGHGKKDTGDWCFNDGFITFRDIAELYSRVFRHQLLTIITDCCHSGAWVDACVKYLEEQGVRPCGHSLKEKGILLKVFASCRPEEVAATNCFFVRAVKNIKSNGKLTFYVSQQLRALQQAYGLDTTEVRCGKSIEEACTLRPEYSWRRWSDFTRIIIHRCIDLGRQSWKFVLLEDDPEKIRRFRQITYGKPAGRSSVNAIEYGKILKSGWGKDPPKEVIDEIESTYFLF